MDGSPDMPGTPLNPEPGEGTVEAGQVTRRSLLTWLGRASVVGLFSPFIDACVRASGSSVTDRGGLDENAPATGVYTVTYSATDKKGNTGHATLDVTVLDTRAPSVNVSATKPRFS